VKYPEPHETTQLRKPVPLFTAQLTTQNIYTRIIEVSRTPCSRNRLKRFRENTIPHVSSVVYFSHKYSANWTTYFFSTVITNYDYSKIYLILFI